MTRGRNKKDPHADNPAGREETKPPDLSYLEELAHLDLETLVDLKKEFSEKEKRVLEIHFAGADLALAVHRAGYLLKHDQTRLLVGRRIVAKFEGNAADHKDIFRRMSFGEVKVIGLMKALAESGNSEAARAQMLATATKCLEMQRPPEGMQGTVVVIERSKGEGVDPPAAYEKDLTATRQEASAQAQGGKIIVFKTAPLEKSVDKK